MKNKILIVLAIVLLAACQKDDEPINREPITLPDQTVTDFEPPVGEEMVVGDRKNNPFSIENLNKAIEIINTESGLANKMAPLAATHLYLKFKPTTKSHCEILTKIDDEGTLTLHAYPLDSEVLQEGTSPLAEGITDPGLNEVYAVIPIGDPIPNVPYDILDRIIPEPDNELLEAVSFVLTGNGEEVAPNLTVEKVFEQEKLARKKGAKSIFGSKWRPTGNILIRDTHHNRNVGLQQAKVSIGAWFKWSRVHTNNNGSFSSGKTFRRKKVSVRTKWKSDIATIRKSWNEILGVAVSDFAYKVYKNNNGTTYTIQTSNEHLWYKGTVHNGLVKVNRFFAEKGITKQIHNANVWVHPGSRHRGAALMLKKYTWAVTTEALFSSWWTWIGAKVIFPANVFLKHLYPDLSLSLGRGTDTRAIDQLVFHEGAHYIHALNTGGGFWGDLFRAETNNILNGRGSYGNGSQPYGSDGELIALSEGWATFIEYRMMEELYGGPSRNFNIENFTMYTRPNSRPEDDDDHWFTTGLFWDLYDTNALGNNRGDFVRLINGTNGNLISSEREELEGDYKPLFDLMDKNTKKVNDLENRIIASYPFLRERTNNTFDAYGY